jgi:hypothetical protein
VSCPDLVTYGCLIAGRRTSIDMVSQKMTVLAPSAGSIAGRTTLVGTVEWQEL